MQSTKKEKKQPATKWHIKERKIVNNQSAFSKQLSSTSKHAITTA